LEQLTSKIMANHSVIRIAKVNSSSQPPCHDITICAKWDSESARLTTLWGDFRSWQIFREVQIYVSQHLFFKSLLLSSWIFTNYVNL